MPIPEAVALKICHDVQEQNRTRRVSAAKMQCWGCQKASKNDVSKMCLHSKPDNRGCQLVNKLFDQNAEKNAN